LSYCWQPHRAWALVWTLASIGTWANSARAVTQTTHAVKEASEILRPACREGDDEACYELGNLALRGRKTSRSFDQAKGFYEQACKLDYTPACDGLAHVLEARGEYVHALELYRGACCVSYAASLSSIVSLVTTTTGMVAPTSRPWDSAFARPLKSRKVARSCMTRRAASRLSLQVAPKVLSHSERPDGELQNGFVRAHRPSRRFPSSWGHGTSSKCQDDTRLAKLGGGTSARILDQHRRSARGADGLYCSAKWTGEAREHPRETPHGFGRRLAAMDCRCYILGSIGSSTSTIRALGCSYAGPPCATNG